VGLGAQLLKHIVGIYIRVGGPELRRLREMPEILPKYDPRVALDDGRAIDLGRSWEELGVFLDGGVMLPDVGPTVGDVALPPTDSRATWSYVEPERVAEMAEHLLKMRRREFRNAYEVDPEDTQDSLPGVRTGKWGSRGAYMYQKLRILASHYAEAARLGQGMLVRIGERI
jgi:hypothetical protein